MGNTHVLLRISYDGLSQFVNGHYRSKEYDLLLPSNQVCLTPNDHCTIATNVIRSLSCIIPEEFQHFHYWTAFDVLAIYNRYHTLARQYEKSISQEDVLDLIYGAENAKIPKTKWGYTIDYDIFSQLLHSDCQPNQNARVLALGSTASLMPASFVAENASTLATAEDDGEAMPEDVVSPHPRKHSQSLTSTSPLPDRVPPPAPLALTIPSVDKLWHAFVASSIGNYDTAPIDLITPPPTRPTSLSLLDVLCTIILLSHSSPRDKLYVLLVMFGIIPDTPPQPLPLVFRSQVTAESPRTPTARTERTNHLSRSLSRPITSTAAHTTTKHTSSSSSTLVIRPLEPDAPRYRLLPLPSASGLDIHRAVVHCGNALNLLFSRASGRTTHTRAGYSPPRPLLSAADVDGFLSSAGVRRAAQSASVREVGHVLEQLAENTMIEHVLCLCARGYDRMFLHARGPRRPLRARRGNDGGDTQRGVTTTARGRDRDTSTGAVAGMITDISAGTNAAGALHGRDATHAGTATNSNTRSSAGAEPGVASLGVGARAGVGLAGTGMGMSMHLNGSVSALSRPEQGISGVVGVPEASSTRDGVDQSIATLLCRGPGPHATVLQRVQFLSLMCARAHALLDGSPEALAMLAAPVPSSTPVTAPVATDSMAAVRARFLPNEGERTSIGVLRKPRAAPHTRVGARGVDAYDGNSGVLQRFRYSKVIAKEIRALAALFDLLDTTGSGYVSVSTLRSPPHQLLSSSLLLADICAVFQHPSLPKRLASLPTPHSVSGSAAPLPVLGLQLDAHGMPVNVNAVQLPFGRLLDVLYYSCVPDQLLHIHVVAPPPFTRDVVQRLQHVVDRADIQLHGRLSARAMLEAIHSGRDPLLKTLIRGVEARMVAAYAGADSPDAGAQCRDLVAVLLLRRGVSKGSPVWTRTMSWLADARALTAEQLEEIDTLFEHYDTQALGKVPLTTVVKGIIHHAAEGGTDVSIEDVTRLLRHVEVDALGCITRPEFTLLFRDIWSWDCNFDTKCLRHPLTDIDRLTEGCDSSTAAAPLALALALRKEGQSRPSTSSGAAGTGTSLSVVQDIAFAPQDVDAERSVVTLDDALAQEEQTRQERLGNTQLPRRDVFVSSMNGGGGNVAGDAATDAETAGAGQERARQEREQAVVGSAFTDFAERFVPLAGLDVVHNVSAVRRARHLAQRMRAEEKEREERIQWTKALRGSQPPVMGATTPLPLSEAIDGSSDKTPVQAGRAIASIEYLRQVEPPHTSLRQNAVPVSVDYREHGQMPQALGTSFASSADLAEMRKPVRVRRGKRGLAETDRNREKTNGGGHRNVQGNGTRRGDGNSASTSVASLLEEEDTHMPLKAPQVTGPVLVRASIVRAETPGTGTGTHTHTHTHTSGHEHSGTDTVPEEDEELSASVTSYAGLLSKVKVVSSLRTHLTNTRNVRTLAANNALANTGAHILVGYGRSSIARQGKHNKYK